MSTGGAEFNGLPQHAAADGAAVSGPAFGRQGAVLAPRFRFCVGLAGPCCTLGGCRASLSVSGALVAQVEV